MNGTHLCLLYVFVLIPLEQIQRYLLEARYGVRNANYEDYRYQGKSRVKVATESNAQTRRVPIYTAESVSHESTESGHYREGAQASGVILCGKNYLIHHAIGIRSASQQCTR